MIAPDTETLDRLYLEWSQFTRARTGRELKAMAALKDIEFIVDGKEDADDGNPNDAMKIMSVVQTALRSLSAGERE